MRLREVVSQQPAVILTVTPTSHPADQVISIRGREGQYQHKLGLLRLTRQLHQHVVRIDRRALPLALFIERETLRDAPDVFPLEESPRVLRVVEVVDLALRAQKRFRITNVRA